MTERILLCLLKTPSASSSASCSPCGAWVPSLSCRLSRGRSGLRGGA
nr:MAG TPA: ubiquitin-binding zinc finger protein [Caudoviricetes sp.]